MKLRWTVIPQLVALAVQVLLPAIPDFPQAWVPFAHALISFFQMASAILAHSADGAGSGTILDAIPTVKLTVGTQAQAAHRRLESGGTLVGTTPGEPITVQPVTPDKLSQILGVGLPAAGLIIEAIRAGRGSATAQTQTQDQPTRQDDAQTDSRDGQPGVGQ